MSSFDPSRIPAWLAPVCEDRSVSHSVRRCVSSASQRAIVGALPSRIARRSTGSASPSISRKTIPGTSVLAMIPCLRAIRCAIRIDDMSSEARRTASTTLTAATTSAASSAQPKLSTRRIPRSGRRRRSGCRRRRQDQEKAEDERERQPQGGEDGWDDRVQRRHDRRDEQRTQEPSIHTPGSGPAATMNATPMASHETTRGNNRKRGRSGRQAVDSPYALPVSLGITFSLMGLPSVSIGFDPHVVPHTDGMKWALRGTGERGFDPLEPPVELAELLRRSSLGSDDEESGASAPRTCS